MKKTEKDYEYLETSPELEARGMRRITRPKFLDKIKKPVALRDCKSRITIYLDADIVDFFKKTAEDAGDGYQTLINRTLRAVVDGNLPATAAAEILTADKLFDREFLTKLKAELETV